MVRIVMCYYGEFIERRLERENEENYDVEPVG
jgi:hypothetical protein